MKRLLALLLSLCLLASAQAALAEGALSRASDALNLKGMEKYASYTHDEATGAFSVRANEASLRLSSLADSASDYGRGALWMALSLEGNSKTGLVQPVLTLYVIGGDELEATGVSVRLGGVRYDFAASAVLDKIDGQRLETIRLPLGEKGLGLLRAMLTSTRIDVRVFGSDSADFTLDALAEKPNAIQSFQLSWRENVIAMLAEYDALGAYALWDLNKAALKAAGASLAEPEARDVAAPCDIALDSAFAMLVPGVKSDGVKAYETLLASKGYFYAKPDTTYGSMTSEATRAAQKFYGLAETGGANAALIACLEGGAGAASEETQTFAFEDGGDARLTLTRAWFAKSVSATVPGGSLAERTVGNSDNLLFIADGAMENVSARSLSLYLSATAKLVYDGKYEYDCSLLCEADSGARFDDTLLPLAQSRLIAYAEVPSRLARETGAWTLSVTLGENTLTWTLG